MYYFTKNLTELFYLDIYKYNWDFSILKKT